MLGMVVYKPNFWLICVFRRGKSLRWQIWLLQLETLHTECLGWMEKSKLTMFALYCDSFQFVLKIFISEISKENKMLFLCFKETTTTVNQTKKKTKERVRSLQFVWLWPCPSDSQFTVQKSSNHTDYHHICLSFAPVFFLPPPTDGLQDMMVGWLVGF